MRFWQGGHPDLPVEGAAARPAGPPQASGYIEAHTGAAWSKDSVNGLFTAGDLNCGGWVLGAAGRGNVWASSNTSIHLDAQAEGTQYRFPSSVLSFRTFGLLSHARLKRDIALVGRLANGLGLYRYRYLWSDTVYVGVMAQEVALLHPEAVVHGADGYLRVNYTRLGLKLMTLPEWKAREAAATL